MPTIQELRRLRPEFNGLDDDTVIKSLSLDYPGVPREKIAADLGVKLAPPPPPPRTFGGTMADTGLSLLKGAIAIPQAAVGLASIASGGRAGKSLEDAGFRPNEAMQFLDTQYSDAQQRANKTVQDAEGFMPTMGAALSNPSVVAHSVLESLPSMAAGGIAGGALSRAVGLGARSGMSAEAAVNSSQMATRIGGAAGEGLTMAGQDAEQIRSQTPDKLLTGEQAAIAGTIGLAGGALALVGAGVARKLGINDVDTMLAGAKANPRAAKGVVRQVLEGAVSEGILEELPQSVMEQVMQNLALGKPLEEGVDNAAVLGLLSGAAMGGGAQLMHGKPATLAPQPAPQPAPGLPPAGPLSSAAQIAAVTGAKPTASKSATGADLAGAVHAAIASEEATRNDPPPAFPAPEVQDPKALADQQAYDDAAANQTPVEPDVAEAQDHAAQQAAIDAAAHEAATSPHNDRPQPTDAQKEAGNYKKGHVTVHGLDVTVENPQGSNRTGKSPDGTEWSHNMSDHYGYVKRTVGADNEQVDVYIGPRPDAGEVYVVDQLHQHDQSFDEHKAMLGFSSRGAAISAYKKNFDKGWKVGGITAMPIEQFKDWLKNGDTKKPVAKALAEKSAPESDQDKSTREWTENYDRVVSAPKLSDISSKDIDRAIHFASMQVAQLGPGKAWDGDQAAKNLIDSLNREMETLKFEQQQRKSNESAKPQAAPDAVGGPAVAPDGAVIPGQATGQAPGGLEAGDKPGGAQGNAARGADPQPVAQPVAGVAKGKSVQEKRAENKKAKEAPAPRAMTEEGRAIDGEPINPGDTFKTSSGRVTAPYPTQKGEKYASTWLVENATAEAKARGDKFNAHIFEQTTPVKGGELTGADRAGMLEYLFGKQPAVVRSILKPLVAAPAPANDVKAEKPAARPMPDEKDPLFRQKNLLRQIHNGLDGDNAPSGTSWAEDPKARAATEKSAADLQSEIDVAEKPAGKLQEARDNSPVVQFGRAMRDAGLDLTGSDVRAWTVGIGERSEIHADMAGKPPQPLTYNIQRFLDGKVVESLATVNLSDAAMAIRDMRTQAKQDEAAGTVGVEAPTSSRQNEAKAEAVPVAPKKPEVSANTIFTEDAAAKARATLKAKLSTPMSGGDPELMQAGITLAGYHIEKGARTFAAYAKAMLEDLGENIRPYLKSFYMAVKYDPRAAAFGMDNAAAVDAVNVATVGKDAPVDAPVDTPDIVEHTTGKGKTLRGVVRTDLTHAQAKEMDPYTFKKDDGYFIREKYLGDDSYKGSTMAEVEAVQNIPTTEKMRQAVEIVGDEEFERRYLDVVKNIGAKTEDQKALAVEATAIEILALEKRKNASTTEEAGADAPVEAATPAPAPAAPPDWNGKKVSIEVTAEDGTKASIRLDVGKELKSLDQREKDLIELKSCIGRGH